MTTSSSSCIIKPGAGIEIKKFQPPVQTETVSGRRDGSNKEPENASSRGGSVRPAAPSSTSEIPDAMEESREEAQRIVLKANQIAADILKEAGKQAEQLKKTAIEEGCREGYEQGYREGREQAGREQEEFLKKQEDEFRSSMERALAAIDQVKEKNVRNFLEELKDCSIAIAEKVIHISLRSSGEVIKRMLIAETEKLRKTAWVKIYMEKTDYDMMLEADANVVSELARLSDNIKFVVMDKEDSGNCIIEMPEEIVDISVDTQMENIREILGNIRF